MIRNRFVVDGVAKRRAPCMIVTENASVRM